MVTASKKTSSLDKVAASSVAKKTTAKKSAVETGASAETTAKTAVKKAVAKTPAVKAAVKKPDAKKSDAKKIATPKAAAAELKPANAPVTRKAAAKKKTLPVSPEHRYHMIATAAYFKAERRGFAGGYEMQDWISAEAEVDAQLNPQSHLGFTQ